MAHCDITTLAGKGSRLHQNVSRRNYRDGWETAFGRKKRKATVVPDDEKAPEYDFLKRLARFTGAPQ